MEGDDHIRAVPTTTQPAQALGRAGPTQRKEDRRFPVYDNFDWDNGELHGLDFIEVDDEGEHAKAEWSASKMENNDISTAKDISDFPSESLEPDTCRICSGPAEPGMPLYHPCKCSGTIRHVHQDCLKSWLDTSHRTRCDLCNHTFTYKKLYSLNMPNTLPARVVVGPMLKQLAIWALIFLRLVLVGTIWLALLPALLHWCWRVGFWLSDYISLRISGKLYYLELYGTRYLNTTDTVSDLTSSIMPSTTFSTPLPDSIPLEVTFPPSLLQALSTAFPTHAPLSSAISSLQVVLQKQKNQPTGTGPSPTPHPNAVMMASAFSHIASIIQDSKYNSRRSRFRPRRVLPGEEYATLKSIALHVSGEAMFGQESTFYWDLLRLGYHLVRHMCGWILSTIFTISTYPYYLVHDLFQPPSSGPSNTTVSTWQRIEEVAEQMTAPIITGQIIAVAIVVAFVLLFFLREWVIVNAEPGVFDDAPPPEAQAAENENEGPPDGQQIDPNVAGNGVPGAFPLEAPADPPAAAQRPAEWDRDVDLAEPRPPSPNIVSLEDQEELMKEVIAWRKEQDKVISTSKAKVDEWQWEKKRVIIDDWKEQKMKAIKDKVAVEDDEMAPCDSQSAGPSDKGKGKGKRVFDESDTKWGRHEFYNLDAAENGGADVEHIEVLQRPIRKLQYLPRRPEMTEDNLVETSTQQQAAPPATLASSRSLANFEFSFSTPRVLPRPIPIAGSASTSSHGESSVLSTGAPPPASLVSSLTHFHTGTIKDPIVVFEKNEEIVEQNTNYPTSVRPNAPFPEPMVGMGQNGTPESSIWPRAEKLSIETKSSISYVSLADQQASAAASTESAHKPTSNHAPPTPPMFALSQLPFSLQDPTAGPLQQKVPETSHSALIQEESSFSPDGEIEETKDAFQVESTFRMNQESRSSSRKRSGDGAIRRQRTKGRVGPLPSKKVQNPTLVMASSSSSPFTPTILKHETTLQSSAADTVDDPSSTAFGSRPFIFPPPALLKSIANTSSDNLPTGYESPKPVPTTFNVHAKPFQPGSVSAPITPSDFSSFRMIQREHIGTPSLPDPFVNTLLYRQPASSPFAYAASDTGSAPSLLHGQAGSSHSPGFTPQPQDIPYSPSAIGHAPKKTSLNASGRPLHGHHMSMGMGTGSERNPIDLPLFTRGRSFTISADTNLPQGLSQAGPSAGIPQLHQRSSSLSTHPMSSPHMLPDENHLLRPSSSSSADSSAASATFSPIPWYGLPDPRPDIDRKKLEELEKRELMKAKHKAASAAAKSKQPKVRAPPPALVILPSRASANLAQDQKVHTLSKVVSSSPMVVEKHDSGQQKIASESQVADQHTEVPEQGTSQIAPPLTGDHYPTILPYLSRGETSDLQVQSKFVHGDSSGVLDNFSLRNLSDFPPLVPISTDDKKDALAQSTTESSPPSSLAAPGQTDTIATSPIRLAVDLAKTSYISSAPQESYENRKRAPGKITMPNIDLDSYNGQLSGSLKRPPLPSAASPIVVEERPSQMALYQAPEEVRPPARQGAEQTADRALAFLMDNYFQPLEHDQVDPEMNRVAGVPLDDGAEILRMLAGLDGLANAAAEDELEVLPEEEVMVEAGAAFPDAANAEEAPAPVPAAAEDVWDDEWTHLLEAVGMTGPWYGIVQNAALVIVIFNVTLGVGIFMPYILGRTTSLIVVDPSDVIAQLATSGDRPLFLGQRFPPLWNPRQGASFSLVGKGVTLLFGDLIPLLKYVATAGQNVAKSYLSSVNHLFGFARGLVVAERLTDGRGSSFAYGVWSVIRPTSIMAAIVDFFISSIRWYQTNMPCKEDVPVSSSLVNVVHVVDHGICNFFPETFKNSATDNRIVYHWLLLSLRDVATDRTLAILFGYLITVSGLAIHARFSVQKTSYMVLMLLKVGCFVLFEAVIKPLLFGFVIDIFTLSLFPGVSIQSRISFWNSAPYSNIFHHWLIGNVVVVQFLYFLQDIQKALRPGALLSIRKILDPATPSIRDMISKSLAWHALKYATTLMSNLFLLWIVLGVTIDVNNLITSKFVPLRWDLRRPLSDVPIDLVILHIFIPATFRFLKLKRLARNMGKTFFTEWSRFLNLQSVLLGETLIDTVAGSYWRVPVAEDAIRLAGRPSAIQTDALGNGLTQEDKDMIDMQIFASRKSQRVPHNDYKVVFYPDQFLLRIAIFLIVLWAAFFGTAWTALTLPIRIGRLTFKLLLDTTTIHDAYSWIVGLYLFWFASFAKYLVGREQRRWSKYLSTRTRSIFPVKLFLRHTAAMLGRLALAVLWLVFLLPFLIGLFFEIYFVLPLTYHFYPGHTPILRLADAWACGMILGAIILRAARLGQPDQLPELFDRIRRDGWFKIKARALASELGVPTLGLTGLVVGPLLLQYLLPTWPSDSYAPGNAVLKVFLPFMLFMIVMSTLVTTAHGLLYLWVEAIRDQTYLDKEIIQNMEELPTNTT